MRIAFRLAVLVAALSPGLAHAVTLSDAEATFLEYLVTAAIVVEQRCPRYEASGTGGVQAGARLLGNPDAAMRMIDAYAAAILAHDGRDYDHQKFRPEVADFAMRLSRQLRPELVRSPQISCPKYGEISAARGLLRRH